jgi:hypothetical protein
MQRKINFLTNAFMQARRTNRKDDRIGATYIGYNHPNYKPWSEAGAPHGVVWRYKGKVIAVRLNFYSTQSQIALLQDSGDRSLPVFNRLHALFTRFVPTVLFFRSNPRKGLWFYTTADNPTPTTWPGKKLIVIQGARRAGGVVSTVADRLKNFAKTHPVDLRKWSTRGDQVVLTESIPVRHGYPAQTVVPTYEEEYFVNPNVDDPDDYRDDPDYPDNVNQP